MRISIFGLGYVGCTTAACLAQNHTVIGVDINKDKVAQINSGLPTVSEPKIAELIAEGRKRGKLGATTDAEYSILNSDVSMVCVATPSAPDGTIDLGAIKKVAAEIGAVLAKKDMHEVVIRSTILPGTTENVIIPILEEFSGKRANVDFIVTYNPEFMREGIAVDDFYNPARTVVGSKTKKTSLSEIYSEIKAPFVITDIKTAELVKYIDNTFHGLKISFANEVGAICKSFGVDSHRLMEIFCMDNKLNLSPYYLKPGFAFGGSCIPKDISALLAKLAEKNVNAPVIRSIMDSNRNPINEAVKIIESQQKKNIGILGVSFKADTDDLRNSPVLELIKLLSLGYNLHIYDPNVNPSKIFGANKAYVEQTMPHLWRMLSSSMEDVVKNSDIIILTQNSEEFRALPEMISENHVVIDLTHVFAHTDFKKGRYIGLWS